MRSSFVLVAGFLLTACGADEGAGAGAPASDGGGGGADGSTPPPTTADASDVGDAGAITTGDASVVDAAPPTTYSGEATWYDAHAGNACGISLAGSDYVVAAMNKAQYKKSLCGQCARVKGPKGEVTVRIVDLCPGCKTGDLDLSEEAFVSISPLSAGRVKITWTFVTCP